MARRVRPHPVRVLLLVEPRKPTLALVTTDLTTPVADIVERYAGRWAIDVAFEDAKQITGVGEARNRIRAAVERTVPFGLYTQSIVINCHGSVRAGPELEDRLPGARAASLTLAAESLAGEGVHPEIGHEGPGNTSPMWTKDTRPRTKVEPTQRPVTRGPCRATDQPVGAENPASHACTPLMSTR